MSTIINRDAVMAAGYLHAVRLRHDARALTFFRVGQSPKTCILALQHRSLACWL